MNEEMRGWVQTVTGRIEPSQLGNTLMHEHLYSDLNLPDVRAADPDYEHSTETVHMCDCFKLNWGQKESVPNFRLNEGDILIEELNEMVLAGGRSVVELSTGGIRPNPEGLVALSQATGVNIVMGCGHYVEAYQDPANASRTVDDFAKEIIGQLTEGAWGTDIRAGIIGEIGCTYPWTEQEKRVLRGALIAQEEVGAAINVHPGRSVQASFDIVEFARAAGAPLDRLIISHMDRTIPTLDDLLRLADTGCVLEFDLFGWETSNYWPQPHFDMPNDAMRVKLIRGLVDRGHINRVLISHDIFSRTRLTHYGGHGYQHIYANILPLMLRRGFSHAEIDQIIVSNPARLLAMI